MLSTFRQRGWCQVWPDTAGTVARAPLLTRWCLAAGLTHIGNLSYDRREFIHSLGGDEHTLITALSRISLEIDCLGLPQEQRMSAYIMRAAGVTGEQARDVLFNDFLPVPGGNLLSIASDWRG